MNEKDNMDKVLESQIGEFGGTKEQESKSLGKLKHKAALGEKEDLTE